MATLEYLLKTIKTIKDNSNFDYSRDTYFVFIDKEMKSATINNTGLIQNPSSSVSYIIAFSYYSYPVQGYTTLAQGLKMLGMFDYNYCIVNSIPFKKWKLTDFTGVYIGLSVRSITPKLELISGESTHTDLASHPLTEFNKILKDIWAFEENSL
ncbi:hypothetical protein LJC05_00175 [Bacteroides sp. OttesenSCG-928-J23]|nr:hypothetical protein [Bacteroides sp. OttesenSCG-928-J23]MDL2305668.1 hypothetical protein [Bacteroides sp. OttesenSCG-928-D19]